MITHSLPNFSLSPLKLVLALKFFPKISFLIDIYIKHPLEVILTCLCRENILEIISLEIFNINEYLNTLVKLVNKGNPGNTLTINFK